MQLDCCRVDGKPKLLVYVDRVNLLDDNANTNEKNTETLLDGSKVFFLICAMGLWVLRPIVPAPG
jgi:hypothetical protein